MYSMTKMIRRFIDVLVLFASFTAVVAQPASHDPKPYKLLTSGKQLTIKSSKSIKHVMLWTIDGNRVVEQKDINNSSYTFNIPVNKKTFYLMIGMNDGTVFTEKIATAD